LFGDPAFELGHIDGWQLGEVGAEALGFFDVDVADFVLGLVGVPVDQDADAAAEAAGDIDFVGAEERDVDPAELAGGEGGEFGVEVAGEAEDGTGDVLGLDAVDADHEREELAGRGEDVIARVGVSSGSASDAAAEHVTCHLSLVIGHL